MVNEAMRHFLEMISSTEDVMDVIGDAIGFVEQELSIGALRYEVSMPGVTKEDLVQIGLQEEKQVLFRSIEGFVMEQPFQVQYKAKDGTSVSFVVARKAGTEPWTDEQREDLELLCRLLWVYGAKSNLTNRYVRARTIDLDTGLYHCSHFIKLGQKRFQEHMLSEYAIMYFNIRQFSRINRMLGHNVGKAAIRKYAKQLQAIFCQEGDVVCHLGGDNFAAMTPKERMDSYIDKIESICLELPTGSNRMLFYLRACIGVYITNGTEHSFGDALQTASECYHLGKYKYHQEILVYSQEVKNDIEHERHVRNGFQGALARGEFCVYYQPKVSLRTYQLCGAEALVRWEKEKELASPNQFISILEKDNSICQLDFYVLECVCQDIHRWLVKKQDVKKISVNFSRKHLQNESVVSEIIKTIDKYQIPRNLIEIEITETVIEEEYQSLITFVEQLKTEGISVALDDFGTGFSSINLLKDLKIDVLKMDKSFLEFADDTYRNQVVIERVIDLAKDLDMYCVSEGIETKEHAEYLRRVECDVAQGFYFDKPMPADEFEERFGYDYSLKME